MTMKLKVSVALVASTLLAACGGGGGSSTAGGPSLMSTVPVPGISSAVSYSFDLGTVDAANSRYYVTDRTNKSVDVVDTSGAGVVVAQFQPGFKGCITNSGVASPSCLAVAGSGINNDASGPDGADVVGSNVFIGDVNALWVLNKSTGAVVKKIAIGGTSGLRADEGCFDSDDNIYAISSPGETPPIMTFVDTTDNQVIATVQMHSIGLEACAYDKTTKRFFVNNDGQASLVPDSTASMVAVVGNPRGEMMGIAAADIVGLKSFKAATLGASRIDYAAGAMVAVAPGAVALPDPAGLIPLATTPVRYALGNCDPTGLAVGPGTDIGAMCRQGTVGETLTFQILNRTTGAVAATVNAGGGDQITYDATSNRWFLATSRWTPTGKSCGGGSAACPLTPALSIVDGTSRTIVAQLPNGNNSHSVAVVPGNPGKVLTPFTAPSATGGGAAFPNGGINIFSTN